MNKIHQSIVQYTMKNGFIEKKSLEDMIEGFKETYKDDIQRGATVDDYLSTINKNLAEFHFKIQVLIHPKTNKTYFGWINEVDDEVSKLTTKYTQTEISFFKKIVIFES